MQACAEYDLMMAEADAQLEVDHHEAFPFGECGCGCALEENGECPACIQQEINDKAMADWVEDHPDVVNDIDPNRYI